MSERRPTAQIINRKRGGKLLQIMREDFAKHEAVCRIVEQALRSCGITDERVTPELQGRVCNYIWREPHIPEQDKEYAVAKIQYGSRQ